MALAYFQEKKLKVNIVRFFNVVGPAQTSDYGMVVPNFIECALNNKDIKVYGDGKQTRTFLHVKDAIVALDKLYSYKKYGNIFNLGGIENISMFNLAAKIRKIIGSNSKIKKINYNYAYSNRKIFSKDYEDINYRDPSISFIKKELNFFPNINLSKILKDIISFKKL
jgi:UDP-glucose 4-epimerase